MKIIGRKKVLGSMNFMNPFTIYFTPLNGRKSTVEISTKSYETKKVYQVNDDFPVSLIHL